MAVYVLQKKIDEVRLRINAHRVGVRYGEAAHVNQSLFQLSKHGSRPRDRFAFILRDDREHDNSSRRRTSELTLNSQKRWPTYREITVRFIILHRDA